MAQQQSLVDEGTLAAIRQSEQKLTGGQCQPRLWLRQLHRAEFLDTR
jgi:hypothetical protein